MATMETTGGSDNLLPRREVIYCGECGLPPEYCEFLDPKFVAAKCDPWLRSNHPDLYEKLAPQRSAKKAATAATTSGSQSPAEGKGSAGAAAKGKSAPKPDKPWTTDERLTEFYRKYVPEKMADVPGLLEKYSGKEDKLFTALTKKYGPEPLDPYYSDSEDDNESGGEEDEDDGGPDGAEAVSAAGGAAAKTRKVAGPKKTKQDPEGGGGIAAARVIIRKVAQKKKRNLTVVSGMETIPGIKLKDASKSFSKRFAGSSSVKDNEKGGQDIILQGDHMYDVAEMIVDKFGVPDTCVWLDIDGDVVPLR
jgi:density-regulated protein